MKKYLAVIVLVAAALCLTVPIFADAAVTTTAAAGPAAAAPAVQAPVPDPGGTLTGSTSDIPAAKAGMPTSKESSDAIGHNRVSIKFVWTLITGFLVMFMQAGFAMVETGLTRAKNAAHTMAMNFMIYPLGMLGFYVCGFALMFGGIGALARLAVMPGSTANLRLPCSENPSAFSA